MAFLRKESITLMLELVFHQGSSSHSRALLPTPWGQAATHTHPPDPSSPCELVKPHMGGGGKTSPALHSPGDIFPPLHHHPPTDQQQAAAREGGKWQGPPPGQEGSPVPEPTTPNSTEQGAKSSVQTLPPSPNDCSPCYPHISPASKVKKAVLGTLCIKPVFISLAVWWD